jgi:hypothetical protein
LNESFLQVYNWFTRSGLLEGQFSEKVRGLTFLEDRFLPNGRRNESPWA